MFNRSSYILKVSLDELILQLKHTYFDYLALGSISKSDETFVDPLNNLTECHILNIEMNKHESYFVDCDIPFIHLPKVISCLGYSVLHTLQGADCKSVPSLNLLLNNTYVNCSLAIKYNKIIDLSGRKRAWQSSKINMI